MASDFAEQLSLATIGSHVDADMTYGQLLGALVDVVGSGAAAARLIGVSPTTFYRWQSGRSSRPGGRPQQPKTSKLALVKAVRRAKLPATLDQQIRKKNRTLKIIGWVIISEDARRRVLHVGREFPPRVQRQILDEWLAGNDEKAEGVTRRAIDRYYTKGMEIDPVESMEWE